jgi:hypothetical protein
LSDHAERCKPITIPLPLIPRIVLQYSRAAD